jgi:hypothetical protein
MRLEERAVVDGVVSRMEEGKGEIDTVYSVFPDNPRERLPMRWRSLRWEEAAEGIVVGRPDQGGVVWVEYRLPPPRWEGAAWAGGSAYAEGCQVWFSDAGAGVVFEGDFWRARAGGAVAGESPASAPEKWECVGVPAFLADFGARGAYDVALRGDAQWARAAMEESAAWSWLYDERDNLQNAGGRVLRLRVPGCRM